MNGNQPSPSIDLYNQVRGAFVMQGSTITTWCRKNGHSPVNAKSALVGVWNGPKGKALRNELIEASGIASPSKLFAAQHQA
jgi:hypothetical protein